MSSFFDQDAKIEPEEFTTRLQAELKSSPQPYLIPFLKVCLLPLTGPFSELIAMQLKCNY